MSIEQVTEPSEAEILFLAIQRRLRGVHTAAPGSIVSYDSVTQTAEIELGVQLETSEGQYLAIPPLAEVPVCQPTTTTFYAHFPLAAGDPVVVVFFEQDPSQWFTKGLAEQPPLRRRHGLYPVAFPGAPPLAGRLLPAETPADKAVWGSRSSGAVVACSNTLVHVGSTAASDPLVLESKLKTAIASASDAAITAAAPNDGGVSAFTAFKSSFAAALISALKAVGI